MHLSDIFEDKLSYLKNILKSNILSCYIFKPINVVVMNQYFGENQFIIKLNGLKLYINFILSIIIY